ncbi:MAG TPA: PhzF family phenazine biosynthesis protein [Bacteroidia bacterium]|nr:PhzF family phenazine biosynthesis protein [Bacteroidia bacterium]
MKTIRIYQVDAFTSKLFGGNPAAVCPLSEWLPDEVMQNIALENNLAETAFIVKESAHYHIRWFTPAVEVDLCGHATLAAAHVLFNHENFSGEKVVFHSRSGKLIVTKQGDELTLDFPADVMNEVPVTPQLTAAFAEKPVEAYRGKTDLMLVFENEKQIATMVPDLQKISEFDGRGVIVTARGNEVDFVSRFFAPQSGIDEDPVTGSAHTSLAPYWSGRLGKQTLSAIQISKRKGYLTCVIAGDRVQISGKACLYLTGEIFVP